MKLKTNEKIIQFIKYTIVSGIAFVGDFSSLYLLVTFAHIHYLIAAALAFITGLIICYVLSLCCVFNKKFSYFDFMLFSIIGIICAGLNVGLIWLFTDIFGIFYILSKILAMPFTLTSNFILRKKFVFEKNYTKDDFKLNLENTNLALPITLDISEKA